jgi:hypothetical protein
LPSTRAWPAGFSWPWRRAAELGDGSFEFPVLSEQVFLDLQCFMQDRLGVLVGVLGPLVGRAAFRRMMCGCGMCR